MLICQFSLAKVPVVIYDNGKALPNYHYVSMAAKFESERPTHIDVDIGFPLKSDLWKPGEFDLIPKGIPKLPMPFFFVACDQVSREWIEKRREPLKFLKAVGYIVTCETKNEFLLMRQFAKDIPLQASQGNDIARKLQHYIYPALVGKEAIEQ